MPLIVERKERLMEITKQEVEKVAKLARLQVSESEVAVLAKQLSQILTHVETLKKYDTEGVEPTATVRPSVKASESTMSMPGMSSVMSPLLTRKQRASG